MIEFSRVLFDEMSMWGCVSAANFGCQSGVVDFRNVGSVPRCCFPKMGSLAFGSGEFMARGLGVPSSVALVGRRQKKGVLPLQVLCFLFFQNICCFR